MTTPNTQVAESIAGLIATADKVGAQVQVARRQLVILSESRVPAVAQAARKQLGAFEKLAGPAVDNLRRLPDVLRPIHAAMPLPAPSATT